MERREKIIKAGPNLCCDSETINDLKLVDFNLACLANNHILDYGEEAVLKTIELLNKNEISHTGVGHYNEKLKPFLFEIQGIKFCILNCAEAEEATQTQNSIGAYELSPHLVIKKIHELKKLVNFVIVIVHAGREYEQIPSPRIYKLYEEFVNNGADVVVGHHPHVPQGIKIMNSSIIAYSLGNFMFSSSKKRSKKNPYVNIGYILKITFGAKKLKKIEVFPHKINRNKISILRGEEKLEAVKNFNEITDMLKNFESVEKYWNKYYKNLLNTGYFPFLIGALINGLSGKKILRKLKILLLTNLWIIRYWGSKRNVAKALNHIKNPTHKEIYINTLELLKNEGIDD